MKIRVLAVCMELSRCGVKVGDEYPAKKQDQGFWFVAPDHTDCVIYEPSCEVISEEVAA